MVNHLRLRPLQLEVLLVRLLVVHLTGSFPDILSLQVFHMLKQLLDVILLFFVVKLAWILELISLLLFREIFVQWCFMLHICVRRHFCFFLRLIWRLDKGSLIILIIFSHQFIDRHEKLLDLLIGNLVIYGSIGAIFGTDERHFFALFIQNVRLCIIYILILIKFIDFLSSWLKHGSDLVIFVLNSILRVLAGSFVEKDTFFLAKLQLWAPVFVGLIDHWRRRILNLGRPGWWWIKLLLTFCKGKKLDDVEAYQFS